VTAFLGVDTTLLGALRAALVRSVDDLRRHRSDDPEAADAMRTIRWGADLLELRWLPVIDRALRLDPASAMRRVEAVAAVDGPLASAPMLSALRIDDDELAALCVRLLVLWHAGDARGNRWPDEVEPGPNAADALFTLLISRPGAASAFLGQVADEPSILFRSAVDESLVHRLLVVGTSPDQVGTAEAGRILVPILDWLQHDDRAFVGGWYGTAWPSGGRDGATPHASSMLGDVIAPWLSQFGHRADEWGWTHEEADDALRWIATDDVAMTALVGSIDEWRATLASTRFVTPDGSLDTDALLDVSTTLSQITLALRAADIEEGEVRRFWLDLSLLLAGAVGGFALPLVGVSSLAAAAATTALGSGTRTMLDHLGIVGSAERTGNAAQARFGTFTADTSVVAIVSIVGQLVDDGRLPAGTLDRLRLDDLGRPAGSRDDEDDCRSAETLDRLQRFVTEIATEADPMVGNALVAVLLAFAGPTSIVEAC